MPKLTFAGAAGEVTGSCHYLGTQSGCLTVDCGFFQGKRLAEAKNADPFPFEVGTVQAVLLTHAHLDHCGRLPKLVKEGFSGPIYATKATIELTKLVLSDTVHILAEHAEEDGVLPLYDTDDVEKVMALIKAVELEQPVQPLPNVEAIFREAGHILGSTFVELKADGQQYVFSGDLGNAPSPLLRPPVQPTAADVVVIESTYGGTVHDAHESRVQAIHHAVDQVLESKGTLVIPTFAVERTQELLFILDALEAHQASHHLPVYLDSPLAIEVTDVYRQFHQLFRSPIEAAFLRGEDPFDFPFLKLTRSVESSRAINHVKGPKIVIAGAGMMEGGRIHHHLVRYLDQPSTVLLIVGFQAPGTLGREIADGASRVKLLGNYVDVRAKVEQVHAFSAHADEPQLLAWLANLEAAPKQLFCVHGEPKSSAALADAIQKRYDWTAQLPRLGQSVEL